MEHIGLYLKDIFFQRKRGQLIYRSGNIQKYLFFHNENLVFAKTNQPQELLGEILYRLGKITEETYSRIDRYIEPKKRLGEVLVKNGLLSEKDLLEGLNYQMREIPLNVFPDFDGEFEFQQREDFADQDFETKINIPLLIEDGIRRMKYDTAIKDFMERKRVYPKSKSFFYRLTEDEKEVLAVIKGDVSSISALRSSRFQPELFWKSLYLFYCLDLIDVPIEDKELDSLRQAKRTSIGDVEKNIADALAMSENIAKMDIYQILGVSRIADQDEIKKSYFRLAKKFHPDLYDRNLPHEIKGVIEEVFDGISKAYQTLIDEEKREAYDAKKQQAPPVDKRDWAKTAEVKFRQGKALYDKGHFQEALPLLEEAIRLHGSKGRYFLLLALIQSKIPAYLRKSEENFVRAIKIEPWNAEGYVGLGLLYKGAGLQVKARKQFEKAVRIDPEHKIALRGLEEGEQKKKTLKDFLAWEPFGKKK